MIVRLHGFSLVGRRWPSFILSPPHQLGESVVRAGLPLTKLSGSAHVFNHQFQEKTDTIIYFFFNVVYVLTNVKMNKA